MNDHLTLLDPLPDNTKAPQWLLENMAPITEPLVVDCDPDKELFSHGECIMKLAHKADKHYHENGDDRYE